MRLDQQQLLVRVRVVDESGNPLPRPWTALERLGTRPSSRGPQTRWYRERAATLRHLADGAVEVRGAPPDGRLRLRVAKGGFSLPAPLPFRPGDELVVALQRGGMLEASALAPPWLDRRAIELELRAAASRGAHKAYGTRDGSRWTYRNTTLRPGVYDASLRLRGTVEPLLQVAGVVVRSGQWSLDPRLQNVDLRGILRRIVLEPVDVRGDPVAIPSGQHRAAAYLLLPTAAGGIERRAVGMVNGQFTITTTQTSVDAVLAIPGHQPVTVRNAAGEMRITVPVARQVTFRLTGLGQSSIAPVWAQLRLEPLDGTSQLTISEAARLGFRYRGMLGPSGTTTLALPEAGRYSARVIFGRRDGKRRSSVEIGHPVRVSSQAAQTVELRASATAVHRAIERVRR